MEKQWVFDSDLARHIFGVRQEFIARFLEPIRRQVALESALDVGAGVGYFARFLRDLGFRVLALDAREGNVTEGRRRNADIEFMRGDVEADSFCEIGRFDMVLCVGLLYHLENPFRAIRNLHAVTTKILIVESMCAPGVFPNLELLDEGQVEDQGLNFVAFYPTEACLVKMLYRAGFQLVYRFRRLPDDGQFMNTARRKRSRTFLIATRSPLALENLVVAKEPVRRVLSKSDPWTTWWSRVADFWGSKVIATKSAARRFLRRGKASSISR